LVKNQFFNKVKEAEDRGATAEELLQLLGRGRSKLGIFEGDLAEGELEIGQIASLINQIEPVETIMKKIVDEYNQSLSLLQKI
jgi:enoyl-[acyl-carrier protein] reductase II